MSEYCDFIVTLKSADNIKNTITSATPLTDSIGNNENIKRLDFENVAFLDNETASINAICIVGGSIDLTMINLVEDFCSKNNLTAKLAYVAENEYCGVATFSEEGITNTKYPLWQVLDDKETFQKDHTEFGILLEEYDHPVVSMIIDLTPCKPYQPENECTKKRTDEFRQKISRLSEVYTPAEARDKFDFELIDSSDEAKIKTYCQTFVLDFEVVSKMAKESELALMAISCFS